MSSGECTRLWEVEAHRDGRLSPDARASFDTHLAHCPVCRRERDALNALSERLATRAPREDDVFLRRLRQRILADADSRLRHDGTELPGRALAAAAAALVLAVLTFTIHERRAAPVARLATISASTGAQWSRQVESGIDHVDLREGVLRISAHRQPDEPRLMLRVPDGTIDDLGTQFVVAVSSGRTSNIEVSEGTVVFHHPGAPDVILSAGSRWAPPAPVLEPPAEPSTSNRAFESPVQTPAVVLQQPAPSRDDRTSWPATREPASRAEQKTAAYSAAAAKPLEAGHDEDAAYLRVVALLREGRAEEARIAGADYLARFPNGFRRPEIERVVHAASSPPSH